MDTIPPIANDQLTKPHKASGWNVLNLNTHNETIKIMKLKRLLDYTDNHPTALDAAIAIIRAIIPKTLQEKNLTDNSILNLFLQTVYKRHHYTSKALPSELCKTLNTGAKYNLNLESPILSLDHK